MRLTRRAFPVFLSLLVSVGLLASLTAGGGAPPGPPATLRVIELTGSPYEMGLVHGRTLKAEIVTLVGRWKDDLRRSYGVEAGIFIREFLKKTDFKPAMERWTPGLLDEVRGIADGAGIDFETIYAYQLIDEIWAIGPDVAPPKCTTIGAGRRKGGPAFVSQTLDIPAFYHGYQTVLRIRDARDGGLETLVFTIPGVVAANGMNSRSVAVCVNAVTQLAYSPRGVPVDFIIRGILRRRSYDEAVKFLRDVQPAAPQTYVLGGPAEAAIFERSARQMAGFVPFVGAEFSYHTNHPMVNDDFNPRFPEALKRRDLTWEEVKARCPRFNFLGRLLKDNTAALDVTSLKGIYRDRGSGINNETTYGCTIMVLGEDPELHIAPGRPDEAQFQVLRFSARSEREPPISK